MKKYIIAFLGVIFFIGAYYFTDSWKISLIILGCIIVYLAWVIGVELGLSNPKERKEKVEKEYRRTKEDHIKKTEDNPTLR